MINTLIINKVTFNLNIYTQLKGKVSLKKPLSIKQKSYEIHVYESVHNHSKNFPIISKSQQRHFPPSS